MGLSEIPPPTTSCSLKRSRSEDPSSLSELCSPPPAKLPFPCHLSILQDLESCLNAAPAVEAAPTPEELVTEMMQSLEKVMGEIEGLITSPADPHLCAHVNYSTGCDDKTPTADFSLQAQDLCIVDNFAACGHSSLGSPGLLDNLCRDMAADADCNGDVPQAAIAHSLDSLDDCRGIASNCDAVLAREAREGDVIDEGAATTSVHDCKAEGYASDGCAGLGSFEHGLEIVGSALAEQNDGQWSVLDELSGDFETSALANDEIDWLDEGCRFPGFTLSQIEEEEGLLRQPTDSYNTELLLLDCYL